MIYNNVEFKKYDDNYFVSENGDVFSTYKQGLLKHYIDCDGYHRVDIHGKHMKIHRMVHELWNGSVPKGKQVNHYNDDKDNNNYRNLYVGNQQENIHDCVRNQHRVGNTYSIKVYDKKCNKILEFPSIKEFIDYSGHSVANGSLSHIKDKCMQWREAENIHYSLYGTPIESTTYKFAKCLRKRFGTIEGITDRDYITNSYHVPVFEEIDPFEKLALESKFQQLSPGGAISYVETADMTGFIYDNIIYAELNTKSDYCQVSGVGAAIRG